MNTTITVSTISSLTKDERNELSSRLVHAKYYALAMQEIAEGVKYDHAAMTHIQDAHRRFKDWSLNGMTLPTSWEDLRSLSLALAA
jgi:tRNA(Arg) A34 adenosine deaminase TadA